MSKQAQSEAIKVAHQVIDKANAMYGLSMPYPKVEFKLRGRTAGKAYSREWRINLNQVLMTENDDFIPETVPHEVCHLITFKRYGMIRRGRVYVHHGWEWKSCMKDMGHDPTRTHNYDTTNARARVRKPKERPYVYTCGCREFNITKLIHGRMQRGQVRRCRTCKGTLKIVQTFANKDL